MAYALLSVTDKSDLIPFAIGLVKAGYDLISTGGTYELLKKEQIPVQLVEEITDFPEMLDGRVKTLHPSIFGGILYKRQDRAHELTVSEYHIPTISIVVVNLYRFQDAMQLGSEHEHIMEQIDIGGPSLIRAAAKNYKDVLVVTSPKQYQMVLNAIMEQELTESFRANLAQQAFSMTTAYDAMIASYFQKRKQMVIPFDVNLHFQREQDLRYGENPHQQAAVYQNANVPGLLTGIQVFHGKELSFNNYNDLNTALEMINEFQDIPTAVAVKHATPCGVASSDSLVSAYEKAYQADPISIFGGIVAVNRELDEATASKMKEIFLEIVVAPSFSEAGMAVLKEKKNLRIIKYDPTQQTAKQDIKILNGKILYQEKDLAKEGRLETVTDLVPSEEQVRNLRFAMKVCKHVKSNAIVFAKNQTTLAIGGGQTSRIMALENAVRNTNAESLEGSVLASDAFFPFDDSVRAAARAGVKAIIQPGGSINDEDSIEACNEMGIAMVFTGIRHFKH